MPESIPADATTDLFDAIAAGNAEDVATLLDARPDLANSPNPDGTSPLLMATYFRRPAIADLLLSRGAELDAWAAAARGELERVKQLLSAHPSLATAHSPDGWTALHLAAHFGHADIATLLLIRGADVDARSTNGLDNTPLHAALAGRHWDIVELLLANGAAVNAQQHGGYTALHAAAMHGDLPLITLLLEHGADPAVPTSTGQTARTLAEEKGHPEVAALLGNS